MKIKLWNNDCDMCCMYCYININKCLCSCIINKIYCFECETGKEMEEENDKRK